MRYTDRINLEEERDRYKELAEFYADKCRQTRTKAREKVYDVIFAGVLGLCGIGGIYLIVYVINDMAVWLR